MERSSESKRAAGAPRRLRISCPKDLTDAEAQMDDTPLIEKVKKGNLEALTTSFPGTATKRKRHGLQEAHNLSEDTNCRKDFPVSTPSDEYDTEAPQGTANSKQRAKKDELVMNICKIPRRARSCATRVPCSASLRLLVPTSQQRSPSPGIHTTREDKHRQVGVKSRLLKDLEAMESEQISDQEVEIAGLLYDLSRSLPTCVQSTSVKCEEKFRREEEELISSSSSIAGLEKLSMSCGPLSYEQKRKRRRVFENQEERPCMPPAERVNTNTGCSVNELPVLVKEGNQVDELESKRGAVSKFFCQQLQPRSTDIAKEPCHEDANTEEERGQEEKASEDNPTHFAEHTYKQDSLELSSVSIDKSELCGQVFGKGGNCVKVSSRIQKGPEESGMTIRKDMWTLLENCTGKVICTDSEKVNQGKVAEPLVKDESRLGTIDVPRWNQGLSKVALSPGNGEQEDLRSLAVENENTVMPDVCNGLETFSAGNSLVSPVQSSASSATTSNGWMDAFPQLGVTKKSGPSWLTNCLHSGSSSHQSVQLPHAASAQHFVRRMRRCATHVHIAHLIRQQQQFLRRPFWPPSCNPHKLNLSTANLQEKEYWINKIPSLQSEHRHTLAENAVSRMPNSRGTANSTKNENCLAGYNSSAQVLSAGAGIKSGSGNSKSMMTPAHFRQNTLHSSGPNTIRLSLNRSPAQNASVFNKGLYSAHLSSQNTLAQQGAALSKCQQGNRASLHVSLSHSRSAQPQAQLLQCEQLKQQHSRVSPPPQICGAGSGALLEGNRLGFR